MQTNNHTKLGLGTAAMGRPQYINIRQAAKEEAFNLQSFKRRGMQVLDEAFEKGVRYFDTAPGYGMAEQLLGEWIQQKKPEGIEVATKWGYTSLANFDPAAVQHEEKVHSLNKLNAQWRQSQELLPFLTTYQIHSATFNTGVLDNEGVLHRLAALKAQHNLRIGITTSGANQLEVMKHALRVEVEGTQLFEAFQVTYNILDQSIAQIFDDPLLRDQRIIIKEALANGRIFPNDTFPHYQPLYTSLQLLASKYEVGVDAIALRFCIDSIPAFKVLSGAAEKAHLIQNLKTDQFKLTEAEIAALRQHQIPTASYWQERSHLAWN
jgi:aryl-alcohol dehydrogenase-like predicted oxidoreductase